MINKPVLHKLFYLTINPLLANKLTYRYHLGDVDPQLRNIVLNDLLLPKNATIITAVGVMPCGGPKSLPVHLKFWKLQHYCLAFLAGLERLLIRVITRSCAV